MEKSEKGRSNTPGIETVLSSEAAAFVSGLSLKSRKKFNEVLRKTEAGFAGPWFKKLVGTDGLYEFSFDSDNHFYRIFAFWDKRNNKNTLIICTHGIEKKTNKTPESALKKAAKMKKDWFAATL